MKIALTQNKTALIDPEDHHLVAGYKWWLKRDGRWEYAAAWVRTGSRANRRQVLMHRLLADAKPGELVDHRNCVGTDNRRENLRIATNAQNQANRRSHRGTSQHKGVSWNSEKRRWRAAIHRDGRHRFLGYFTDPDLAAKAYDAASRGADGDFARTNFE